MAKRPPDYRDFKTKGKAGAGKPDVPEGYWWTHSDKEIHASLFDVIHRISKQQGGRNAANARFIRMYGDATTLREAGVRPPAQTPRSALVRAQLQQDKLTYNVCRVCVGTATAKVAKQRPKISPISTGGDWELQQKAKMLDKFLRGAFYTAKVPLKGREAFRDGCVADGGVLKAYRKGKRLCVDRVLPGELYVDEMDGLYGEPRCLYQVKSVPREVLLADYGTDARMVQLIKEANPPDAIAARSMLRPAERLSDFVMVVEAWHLPSGEDAGDGKHVIAISNTKLDACEWSRPRFPFAFFRWEKRVTGFWGQGLVEQVAGDQVFINRTLQAIARSLRFSVPRTFLPKSAGVPEEHISNNIGDIILFGGQTPPIFSNPNMVPPELFQALEQGIQRAIGKVGMSQLSTSGQKVPGLNSGVAIREQQDVETDRFSIQAQDYEQMYLDLAEVLIDEAEAACEEGEDIEVNVPDGKKGMESLSFKDVNLDRDAYSLQLFPTSSLPQTPAARKQTVSEWQQAGWIDAQEARRLMDIPDLEASNNMALAAYEDIEQTISDMLEGKEYRAPEPMQDLNQGMKRAQQAFLYARRQGAPEKVLNNLDTWWNAAKTLLDKQMPPPMAGPPPGMPPGPPGPPPGPPGMPPMPGMPQ